MDAVAVSISTCIALKGIPFSDSLKMAGMFGLFQAVMPLIGWLAGLTFRKLIQGTDHWIAFVLLGVIGGKMIVESFRMKCESPKGNSLSLAVLLGLAVATSIDALAAGVSFALLKLNILTTITIIGSITFALSFTGTQIGQKVGCRFSSRVERLGGLILIVIGLKILIQHLVEKI